MLGSKGSCSAQRFIAIKRDVFGELTGGPDTIRTCDLCLRRAVVAASACCRKLEKLRYICIVIIPCFR